jgi:transposase
VFRITLSLEQRQALDVALNQTKDASRYRRLKVLDLASRGYSVRQLAAMFDLSEETVRSYLRRFQRQGLAGLLDTRPAGRPRKLPSLLDSGAEAQENWRALLQTAPRDFPELGSDAEHWTLKLLAKYIQLHHGVEVSAVTIYNVLNRLGLQHRGESVKGRLPRSRHDRSDGSGGHYLGAYWQARH